MSLDMTSSSSSSERVCYVHCNFCNTILATLPLQDLQKQQRQQSTIENGGKVCGSSSSSSKCIRYSAIDSPDNEQPRTTPIRPPEKRQRVPSAYNRFIKEEIQRIKTSNPDISHREAFSTAAKNWAHFPHIHFGLKLESSNKQAKLDHAVAGEGPQKSLGLY